MGNFDFESEPQKRKMVLTVYYSGQTFSNQVRNEQRMILDYLRSNGIEHSTVDMSQNPAARREILTKIPEESSCSGMAPIIFNEEDYLGQFHEFFSARESDKVYQFLNLDPPENSREMAIWKRENAPPTPEPEPEPEAEGAGGEAGEEAGEGGEDAEGLPEGYPVDEEAAEGMKGEGEKASEDPAEATEEPAEE